MALEFKKDAATGQTLLQTGYAHEGKNIVMAIDTVIMENRIVDILTSSSFNVNWYISRGEEDIVLRARLNNKDYIYNLDAEKVIRELANLIKTNKTLESCENLMSVYNNANTDIFNRLLEEEGMVMGSNNIHKGYLKIYNDNKLIGTASRFMITSSNQLYICEYVGKNINKGMQLRYKLMLPDTTITFKWRKEFENVEFDLFDSNISSLGHFGAYVTISSIKEEANEIPEINYLKVSDNFTNSLAMNRDILINNTNDEINAYKISMKPKTELININQFMLREFLV